MFHNILEAIDGSPDAEQALMQAIDLAESEHSRLSLITAVQKLPPIAYAGLSGAPFAQIDASTRSWAQRVLRRARDRVPDDLPVTTILIDRPIRAALIDQINRGRHDLVAMGSRGRGAIRAALLGSVSHYILNHSPTPVLIVHADIHLTTKLADPNPATQPNPITTLAAGSQPPRTLELARQYRHGQMR